ncbi:cbb3-type cytochrome c oxidase N-terminal domain-containing protein [Roseivirga spongicola]|uniref:Cytochrome c domain-containing protein n=1 Tax=Roseivirga spongicola TaxID=333140 RepID=A0A150XBW5_9BACT|nr:cbb3-type cytochrome c oxidase N-terminal domain-containing protein [Roseivirga spongicola]KYG76164.1 hypothetical protein AWW68_08535 [Roseivirga spongicola]WPZ10563.1 cbb3-type cytochrome c oxidase N-terminal domain-containing protein [Roseivirga spongicola]
MNILRKFKHKTSALMVAILMLLGTKSYAQTTAGSGISQETMLYITFGLVFLVSLLVLLVAIYVLQLLKGFIRKEMTEEQLARQEAEPGWFAKLWAKWNDFRPMEEEEELLLDHDYDGIKELDNHLPPWWKGLFYVTVVYAVVYLLIFHVFKTAPLQEEQYEREIAAAEALKANAEADLVVDFDENTVTATTDATELADGQKFFEAQCAVCHKADGGGLAGPNLTDEYWRNGGGISNIYKVIKNGVPNTAMISWESQLNPIRMRNVASYVMTLQGTNPPGALPPDGELYEPENE